MKIYIKYMVSHRCKMVVKTALDTMELQYMYVDLGEVDLVNATLTDRQQDHLKMLLHKSGLELLEDNNSMIVERIKNLLVTMIHYSNELPKLKFSEYLSSQLNQNYTYLSNLFKDVTGTTIQHYILLHKIEKAKELILYDELTLNEISDKLHYSSVAHFSNQFKKMTGLTPAYFKKLNSFKKRLMLESI